MSAKSKLTLKSQAEIAIMVEGGQRLSAILSTVVECIKPGVTTQELENRAESLITKHGGQPTFRDFQGYPAVSCISINDEVVHGIPGPRIIKVGDIVGLDLGLKYHGFCTDMAVTVPVGKITPEARKLLKVTQSSLEAGIRMARAGNRMGDISAAIQQVIEKANFGVVRDLIGHGIGRLPHEEPAVPNFGHVGTGLVLEEGMVLAIEPMVTVGSSVIRQLPDGWTIVTADGSLAAHFEHTVAITKDGPQILTEGN